MTVPPAPRHEPARRRAVRIPRHASGKRPRAGRWWALGITVVVLALAVPVGLLGLDALSAKSAADNLRATIDPARQAASDRDSAELTRLLAGVSTDMAEFADHTDGPLWEFFSGLPWVGDQVTPLMVAGEAIGELQVAVVAPLAEQDLSLIEGPPIVNGRIDPYIAEPFVPILTDAQRILTEQQPTLEAVELDATVDMVASGFITLRDAMVDLLPPLETAIEVLPMVPQLLGAGTERSYLVMIANNAEPRARGGMYGAQLEVTVADGAIVLGDYYAADRNTGDYPRGPFLPTTDEELAVFGPNELTKNLQDMAYTPEFPRVAEIASRFWDESGRDPLSGIISIDPVAMQYILGDMDPVEVEGLTVTSDTVASALLGDIYLKIPDPFSQDAVFAAVASNIFDEIMSGNIDFDGLNRAMSEHRVLAWSPDADEEAFFETLDLDGEFVGEGDTIGLFLNDRAGSKLGFYLDTYAVVAGSECRDGRAQRLDVAYTITLDFEGDIESLPWYVAGGKNGVPAGHYAGWVQVYAPSGAEVIEVQQGGAPISFEVLPHEQRSVVKLWVDLVPQQTSVLRIAFSGDFPESTEFVTTPTSKTGTYGERADLSAMRCSAA